MPEGREDAARKFYADILELTESEKPDPLKSRGGCWFQGGGVIVHLGVEEDFAPARKAHPAFLVADLEMLRGLLDDAGISVTPDHIPSWSAPLLRDRPLRQPTRIYPIRRRLLREPPRKTDRYVKRIFRRRVAPSTKSRPSDS